MLDNNQYATLKQCLSESTSNREVIEKFKKLTNIILTPSYIHQMCNKYDGCNPSHLMRNTKVIQQFSAKLLILADVNIQLLKEILNKNVLNAVDCIIIPSFHVDEMNTLRLHDFIAIIHKKRVIPIALNLHFSADTYKLYGHLYDQTRMSRLLQQFVNVTYHGTNIGNILVNNIAVGFSAHATKIPSNKNTDLFIKQTDEHVVRIPKLLCSNEYIDISIEKNSYSVLTITKCMTQDRKQLQYTNTYERLFK